MHMFLGTAFMAIGFVVACGAPQGTETPPSPGEHWGRALLSPDSAGPSTGTAGAATDGPSTGTAGAATGCDGTRCATSNSMPSEATGIELVTRQKLCEPQEPPAPPSIGEARPDEGCESAACGDSCSSCDNDFIPCNLSDMYACSSHKKCVPITL